MCMYIFIYYTDRHTYINKEYTATTIRKELFQGTLFYVSKCLDFICFSSCPEAVSLSGGSRHELSCDVPAWLEEIPGHGYFRGIFGFRCGVSGLIL